MAIIYHNPKCGTSRNVLAMLRAGGGVVTVRDALTDLPRGAALAAMIAEAGLSLRAALRQKGTPYAELGLDNPALDDAALLAAIEAHPVLLNRPFVVTDKGTRLARPSEVVLEIMENPPASFTKEDGTVVTG